MNTTTKKQVAISATIAGSSLVLEFANAKVLTLGVDNLSSEICDYAMMHGLKQKLVDAAAISCNPETGRPATIDDKYQAVKEVYDRLLAGVWNKIREGGMATGGLLFAALCRMYEGRKTPEQLREYLAGKTDAEKAALRKNPKISAIIDQIRIERGGEDTSEDMLAELDD